MEELGEGIYPRPSRTERNSLQLEKVPTAPAMHLETGEPWRQTVELADPGASSKPISVIAPIAVDRVPGGACQGGTSTRLLAACESPALIGVIGTVTKKAGHPEALEAG